MTVEVYAAALAVAHVVVALDYTAAQEFAVVAVLVVDSLVVPLGFGCYQTKTI